MRVLVAGGTGFIGSHLVGRLVKQGMELIVPVRKKSSIKYLPSGNVEIKTADLLNPTHVNEIIENVDVVFHLVSIRGSGWSFNDEEINAVNVGITKNLLRATVSEGVKHFIYVSSVSVYGHPRGGPIDENFPCRPVTRYGKTKYASERLVDAFKAEEKLPVTIVRPVITYGPRDTWGMIPKLITLINSKRYLTVGNGENRVHLIYIDDLIEGLLSAMKDGASADTTYNLAGTSPVTINRLVEIVSSALDKNVPIFHVPKWFALGTGCLMEAFYRSFSIDKEPFITRDKIDIMCRDRFFDIRKAEKNLRFGPKIGYQEGIKKTLDWLKRNRII